MFSLVRRTVPAHQRRRASTQAVANRRSPTKMEPGFLLLERVMPMDEADAPEFIPDAGGSSRPACERWFARRRLVQPDVIRPVEGAPHSETFDLTTTVPQDRKRRGTHAGATKDRDPREPAWPMQPLRSDGTPTARRRSSVEYGSTPTPACHNNSGARRSRLDDALSSSTASTEIDARRARWRNDRPACQEFETATRSETGPAKMPQL